MDLKGTQASRVSKDRTDHMVHLAKTDQKVTRVQTDREVSEGGVDHLGKGGPLDLEGTRALVEILVKLAKRYYATLQ